MRLFATLVFSLAIFAFPQASPLRAQSVGTVSFPVSCSTGVQKPFERGDALLHSFEYNAAAAQFQEIARREPGCAMAYWGEAMSLYHQLWDRPSKANLEKGAALIRKAQAASPKSPRERGYIQAAAAFYRTDAHTDYDARSQAYSQALGELHKHFPDEDEAAAFYALSLIASPQSNDNNFAYRRRAVAILNGVFSRHPNHPGAAHYLIHACDNPQMAAEGLAAARRYAEIAPASPHAIHMPSHIFARLGLWSDDVQSNLASKRTAEQQRQTAARLHAMVFLEYAYLQLGDFPKAKAVEIEAIGVPQAEYSAQMKDSFYYTQGYFPALYLLETGAWKSAASLPLDPKAPPDLQAQVFWARAVAAGHLRDSSAATAAVRSYDLAVEAVRKTSYAYVVDQMKATTDEAHAWKSYADGNLAQAAALLKATADQQDRDGKRDVDIPAREMLADMLLDSHQPVEALAEYSRSLKANPNRLHGLCGAARAAEMAHQSETARMYREMVTKGREIQACPEWQ